ncbi:MAG: FtsQ-type POTRA domain-containing protein [Nitrospirae bacterium]|nr:FtsQ-type POTRA domain-containing protein [Nitrospirota bacterium]
MKTFRKPGKSRSAAGKAGASRKRAFSGRPFSLVLFLLFTGTLVFLGVRAYKASAKLFPLKEVVFYGNRHLGDGELRAIAGLDKGESLLTVSAKGVSARLLQSPWIREVSVRKDFPGRMIVRISETSPFAILETKGRAFLIDDRGKMLEEMKGSVPFLPVITADPLRNRESFSEALQLAKVVSERKIATERNRVEIVADKGPESLSMVLDDVLVKIGQGDYEQKLGRLFSLEDEIKKRAIAVDYVDLRFANKVVVKPISEVVK